MARTRRADGLRELNDSFALSASRATRQPNAQLLRRRLRYPHQHAHEAFRHLLGRQRFLDEVSYAILDTQPRPQTGCPARFGIFKFGERVERLLHRSVVAARRGFLAQTDERSAEQRLQLDVFLFSHLLADLHEGILQPPARPLAIEFGELAKSDGGFFTSRGVFIANTRGIL